MQTTLFLRTCIAHKKKASALTPGNASCHARSDPAALPHGRLARLAGNRALTSATKAHATSASRHAHLTRSPWPLTSSCKWPARGAALHMPLFSAQTTHLPAHAMPHAHQQTTETRTVSLAPLSENLRSDCVHTQGYEKGRHHIMEVMRRGSRGPTSATRGRSTTRHRQRRLPRTRVPPPPLLRLPIMAAARAPTRPSPLRTHQHPTCWAMSRSTPRRSHRR